MSSLSIVVPALNEALNIECTYKEILLALDTAAISSYEILFIDDGSNDNTFQMINSLAKKDPRIVPIRNEKNLGLGGTYKKAIQLARKEYFMLIPGDNAWPAEGLSEILKHLGQKDIIIPYLRVAGDKGICRKILSKTFTYLINRLFNLNIQYYNGVVIHRLANLKKISIITDSFAYQAEALVKLLKTGSTYMECGISTRSRPEGKSKALRLKNFLNVVSTIAALRFKWALYGESFNKR